MKKLINRPIEEIEDSIKKSLQEIAKKSYKVNKCANEFQNNDLKEIYIREEEEKTKD